MSSRNDARVPYPVNGGGQSVAFTATSAATTNAVGAQTRRITLWATADCYINFGTSPTATSADMFLPSNTNMFLAIRPGEKVAAIRDTADGTLHISEMDY